MRAHFLVLLVVAATGHPRHPAHPEHPEHPKHPEHPTHPKHPEHPEHPEHPGHTDRPEHDRHSSHVANGTSLWHSLNVTGSGFNFGNGGGIELPDGVKFNFGGGGGVYLDALDFGGFANGGVTDPDKMMGDGMAAAQGAAAASAAYSSLRENPMANSSNSSDASVSDVADVPDVGTATPAAANQSTDAVASVTSVVSVAPDAPGDAPGDATGSLGSLDKSIGNVYEERFSPVKDSWVPEHARGMLLESLMSKLAVNLESTRGFSDNTYSNKSWVHQLELQNCGCEQALIPDIYVSVLTTSSSASSLRILAAPCDAGEATEQPAAMLPFLGQIQMAYVQYSQCAPKASQETQPPTQTPTPTVPVTVAVSTSKPETLLKNEVEGSEDSFHGFLSKWGFKLEDGNSEYQSPHNQIIECGNHTDTDVDFADPNKAITELSHRLCQSMIHPEIVVPDVTLDLGEFCIVVSKSPSPSPSPTSASPSPTSVSPTSPRCIGSKYAEWTLVYDSQKRRLELWVATNTDSLATTP